jgi:hypothetical protein
LFFFKKQVYLNISLTFSAFKLADMSKSLVSFSKQHFQNFGGTFLKGHLRFPLAVLCSLAMVAVLFYVNHSGNSSKTFDLWAKTIHTFALGVPLFFALEILGERNWWNKQVLRLTGIVILVLFYVFSTYDKNSLTNEPYVIRTITLAVIFHLLVAVLPYLKNSGNQAFWQYNKSLFLAIFTAFLYSFTLFAGLSLAILAVDKLFEAGISDKIYADLGIFIAFYVNTILFAGNLPSLESVDRDENYPTQLKLFTQYVLLPLVAVYLLILLSYEIKILTQWSLPKGWVSNLVLVSGVFGILAFLLLFPIRSSTTWVRRFNRLFYWLLLPLIALMMVAIFVRIRQYGITELRYFVALLSCWLLGISVYFILSKKDKIRWIPQSLILILLLSLSGPLSSTSVSAKNQKARLNRVLDKYKLLKNGKLVVGGNVTLDKEDSDKLSAALEFLSIRKWESLSELVPDQNLKTLEEADARNRKSQLWKLMGVKNPAEPADNEQQVVSRKQEMIQKIYRADYMFNLNLYEGFQKETIESGNLKVIISALSDTAIELNINGEKMVFEFDSVLNLGLESSAEKLTFHSESAKWKGILVINYLNKQSGTKAANVDAVVYLINSGG